jgi:agmatine deiminase
MDPEPIDCPSLEGSFRLPAEWEPQAAVWLAWPHRRADWPGKFGPIPWVFVEIARLITPVTPLTLLVPDAAAQKDASRRLDRAGVNLDRVQFLPIPTDRGWMRDCGPQFALQTSSQGLASLGILDWRFNAWAKYPEYKLDDRVPARAARRLKLPRWKPRALDGQRWRRIVLEGGAIDSNGQGTLLVTEECLLDTQRQARNPWLDRQGYESVFQDWLGIEQTLWLGRGILGDDTHGHIDDIARFVAPRRIVAAVERNPKDPNYEPLRENLVRLQSSTNPAGEPFEIVELPMPAPLSFEGDRLPASYANFLITNQRVLVPTFNDPEDRVALRILAQCFPEREVIGVHAVDLVWGLGTIHCLTREQPATPPA